MSTQFKVGDTVERIDGDYQHSQEWKTMVVGDIDVITDIKTTFGAQALSFKTYGPGHSASKFKLISKVKQTKVTTPLKGSDIKLAIEAAIIQGQVNGSNIPINGTRDMVPEQVDEIYKTFIIDKQKSNHKV